MLDRVSKYAIVYSYTGFLIKCSILHIQQGFENALVSENTSAVNILGF